MCLGDSSQARARSERVPGCKGMWFAGADLVMKLWLNAEHASLGTDGVQRDPTRCRGRDPSVLG